MMIHKQKNPPFICKMCEKMLKQAEAGSRAGGGGCGPAVEWVAHSRTNCPLAVCAKPDTARSSAARSGRPTGALKQKMLRGAAALHGKESDRKAVAPVTLTDPPSNKAHTSTQSNESGMDIPFDVLQACSANHTYMATVSLDKDRFLDKYSVEVCALCQCVVDGATQAACCEELFCARCIEKWLASTNQCPVCQEQMLASTLHRHSKILSRIIGNWSVHCDFFLQSLHGCPEIVRLSELQNHVAVCQFNASATAATTPVRAVRPSSTVAEVISASPSKLQGNVATHLISHLVKARTQGDLLEIKSSVTSKCQSLAYLLRSTGKVTSHEASARTLKRQEAELTQVAKSVCGGTAGARAQQVADLKRMSPDEQRELLKDTGISPTAPKQGTALAIKSDLRLPWRKLRVLRKWLKPFGVQLQSERKLRTFISENTPSYTAKEIPLMKRTGETHSAEALYYHNLVELVTFFLEKLHDADSLIWHNGIPDSEVWVKIGGDHGGGSFKLCFQVRNTHTRCCHSVTIRCIGS